MSLSRDTLHAIVGVLEAEAEHCEVAAHLAVENHNRCYAEAKVARAARLRGYVGEIHAYLNPPANTPSNEAIVS